jgi:cytoskeletal protein RodZ
MQITEGRNSRARWIQRGVIAVAVVALLAGAAFVWGNRLYADTQQASTQRSADASVFRSESLRNVAAVRAADSAASSENWEARLAEDTAARQASSIGSAIGSAANSAASYVPLEVRLAEDTAARQASSIGSAADSAAGSLRGVAAVRIVDSTTAP